jgi:hypothetical protein
VMRVRSPEFERETLRLLHQRYGGVWTLRENVRRVDCLLNSRRRLLRTITATASACRPSLKRPRSRNSKPSCPNDAVSRSRGYRRLSHHAPTPIRPLSFGPGGERESLSPLRSAALDV